MDENGNVYMLRGPVVCIETGTNKPARIYVSVVPRKDATRQRIKERRLKVEAFNSLLSSAISVAASLVMLSLALHMAGIF